MKTESHPGIAEILRSSGITDVPVAIAPLRGGANNRVFRVETAHRCLVVKCYFQHPSDLRNRCRADFEFARFAWDCGCRLIPEPLGISRQHHAAVFEYIEGRKIAASEITPLLLDQSADLFVLSNCHRQTSAAQALEPASESCFSIQEHLDCAQRRVNRLQAIDTSQPLGFEAKAFFEKWLVPAWKEICASIALNTPSCLLQRQLVGEERCVSPSDFGFHNALLDSVGILRFFDFEYSGWDDPAKMICDFFCQPEIPVPKAFALGFCKQALAPFTKQQEIMGRARLLFPLYQIKWCCIILNEFIKADAMRRSFAMRAPLNDDRKASQLTKARMLLEELNAPGEAFP